MARIRQEIQQWPAWRYSPTGEGAIFNSPDEVPPGWSGTLEKAYVSEHETVILDPEVLAAELTARGVKVLGTWSAAYMKELLEQ